MNCTQGTGCGLVFYTRWQLAQHRCRADAHRAATQARLGSGDGNNVNVPLMSSARFGLGVVRSPSDLRQHNSDFQAQLQARLANINLRWSWNSLCSPKRDKYPSCIGWLWWSSTWVDLDLVSSPCWWGWTTIVATYCRSRVVERAKS